MNEAEDRTADVVPATLEHEMSLIREAIALVATGDADEPGQGADVDDE